MSKRLEALKTEKFEGLQPVNRSKRAWTVGMLCPGFMNASFIPIVLFYISIIGGAGLGSNYLQNNPNSSLAKIFKTKTAQLKQEKQNILNPNNKQSIPLPENYAHINQVYNEEGYAHWVLQNQQANYFENIVYEKVPDGLTRVEYARNLIQNLAQNMDSESDAQSFEELNSTDEGVLSFQYQSKIENAPSRNHLRIWSHDEVNFWYVISSYTKEDKSNELKSSKLMHTLIKETSL